MVSPEFNRNIPAHRVTDIVPFLLDAIISFHS